MIENPHESDSIKETGQKIAYEQLFQVSDLKSWRKCFKNKNNVKKYGKLMYQYE